MDRPTRLLPTGRKWIYLAGLIVTGIGILLCLSVLVFVAVHIGDIAAFEAKAKSLTLRGLSGLVLVLIGFVAMTIGSPGLGDFEKATENLSQRAEAQNGRRCPLCQALNDDAAKFCDQCGQRL